MVWCDGVMVWWCGGGVVVWWPGVVVWWLFGVVVWGCGGVVVWRCGRVVVWCGVVAYRQRAFVAQNLDRQGPKRRLGDLRLE